MQNPEDPALIYIGLMSGTSMDGIDAVLVRFGSDDNRRCDILASHKLAYPESLHEKLTASIRRPDDFPVDSLGELDQVVANCFADAVTGLLREASVDKAQIAAIGSHGQTIRHRPDTSPPFTLQLGDPNRIAARTGITTVADFRRRDIALGGQGAPLAPAFHEWFFSDQQQACVVLNIGGIANITILHPGKERTSGFDTGPGNTLLDAWIRKNKSDAYDLSGAWAASGTALPVLLQQLLCDAYLSISPPKSTGFEYFNLHWLQHHIEQSGVSPLPYAENVQATLAEFSAQSIADAIHQHAPAAAHVYACGGGVHNDDLMTRLQQKMPDLQLLSTTEAGLDPDWVEACAFAWLAMRTLNGLPGNLPAVTGASQKAVLGGVFFGG